VTPLTRDVFDSATAERRLCDYFAVATMDGLSAMSRLEATAAAAAVTYIDRTQVGKRPPLSPPSREAAGTTMAIDPATRANLELTRTLAGERRGSLLDAIDCTVTAAGSRLLAQRLAAPLTDSAAIARRLDAVTAFVADSAARDDIRSLLKGAAASTVGILAAPMVVRAESKSIKIGMTTILSGRVAQLGTSSRNAVMMEVEKINAAGGLAGRQIEMVIRDSKGQPQEAARVARELINTEGCELLIDAEASSGAFAAGTPGSLDPAGSTCGGEPVVASEANLAAPFRDRSMVSASPFAREKSLTVIVPSPLWKM